MEGHRKKYIKISNYKCFGDEKCGYEKILPINLIIGRNNSGKSSLIDLIAYTVTTQNLSSLDDKVNIPRVIMSDKLGEAELRKVFRQDLVGGPISRRYSSHWEFGKQCFFFQAEDGIRDA